jgi:hypothetical protein
MSYQLIHQVIDPAGFVYNGDCRLVMHAMEKHRQVRFRLAFCDPPFGTGVNYDGDFDDNMTPTEYRDFTLDWMARTLPLLTDGGRLVVHVQDHCVYPVLKAGVELGLHRDEWIVWTYRFGQNQKTRFTNGKCHGLVFTNNPDKTIFNVRDVLVPSDRATRYKDPRTQGTATPGMRTPLDVWGWAGGAGTRDVAQDLVEAIMGILEGHEERKHDLDVDENKERVLEELFALEDQIRAVQTELKKLNGHGAYWGRVTGSHSNKERRPNHENQLPEKYLERIIKAYTNPGDWVIDPMSGSGTTIAVARALGRNAVAIEQSETYCRSIAERVDLGAVRVESEAVA